MVHVDELIRLYFATDPAVGEATAKDKNLKADAALTHLKLIVIGLAQWAIDHRTGIAINGLPTSITYDLTPETRHRNTDILDELNAHEHEVVGDACHDDMSSVSVARRRGAVIAHLVANPANFPMPLVTEVCDAFRGLGVGDTRPLLQEVRGWDKVDFPELKLQLRAT